MRGRYRMGPGGAIFDARTLYLPNLLIKKSSDIIKLDRHLDTLVRELDRLKFRIRSFAKDFIAKQYIVLKYDLYFDTINHLQGWYKEMKEGGKGEDKQRNYWLVVDFIGYQFRSCSDSYRLFFHSRFTSPEEIRPEFANSLSCTILNVSQASDDPKKHGPKEAYRMIWGLVKGITESTVTIMYLDELHPNPKSAFEDLIESVMRGSTCQIYISKSNEKSVTMLQHYVQAGEDMTQFGTAVKNKCLENRIRDDIMIQGVERAVEECEKRKLNVFHGPPGCGKTYTGVHIALDRIFSKEEKVLFVARRNVTVDDFLIKYRKRSESVRGYSRDSILRLGSMRKADVNSTLNETTKYFFYDEHRERWKRKRSNRELIKGINREVDKISKRLRDIEKKIQSDDPSVSKSLTVTAIQIARNTELKRKRILNAEDFNSVRLDMVSTDKNSIRVEPTARMYTLSTDLEVESETEPTMNPENESPDPEDKKIEFHKTMIFSNLENLNTFASGSRTMHSRSEIFPEDEAQFSDSNATFHFKSVPKDFQLPSKSSPIYKKDSKDMSELEKRELVCTALKSKMNGLISRIYAKYDSGKRLVAQLAGKRNEKEALYVERSPEVRLVAVTVDSLNLRYAGEGSLLAKLDIKTVIVDEASEIFTSDLMATLPTTVQKLILIGDHKQLQPRRENKIPYIPPEQSFMNFLMEAGVPVCVLARQFRMVPDLFTLQRDLYGYKMEHTRTNDERTRTLLKHDMFWWDCPNVEAERRDFRSTNPEEGWRAVQLARLLTRKCSREKQDLVILTGYRRQVKLIEDRLKEVGTNSNIGRILVTTIDGFQGLERETVILSLVRNCQDSDVGFMADRGRRAVALSRARDQLYIIGDAATFEKVPAWTPVVKAMRRSGHLNSSLPLQCIRHSDNSRKVNSSRELEQIVCSRARVCEDCGI